MVNSICILKQQHAYTSSLFFFLVNLPNVTRLKPFPADSFLSLSQMPRSPQLSSGRSSLIFVLGKFLSLIYLSASLLVLPSCIHKHESFSCNKHLRQFHTCCHNLQDYSYHFILKQRPPFPRNWYECLAIGICELDV